MDELTPGTNHDFGFVIWLVLLGILLTNELQAGEFRLEAGAGVVNNSRRADGLWYQNEYENSHDLRDFAWQGGVSWFTTGEPWRVGARAAYVSLGKVSSNALAIRNEYDRGKSLPCDSQTQHGDCFAQFSQQTSTKGWSLGPVIERDLGSVVASVEAGPFFGRSKVQAHVENITLSEPAIDLSQTWNYTTWYAGGGMRYRYLTLDARWYQNLAASGGFFGKRSAYTMMFGISVPI